ncbi:Histone-arginine methyltransferase METTL23 [Trichinella spiralis]|uniref:Histone-arginine methyltransferase METTL23 n=1 Tax=Trichinella spiralis TaxID=6334 RepID=A0ABR3KJE8_TRISP
MATASKCTKGEKEEDYGLHVWPCAEVLSSYIISNIEAFRGKTILELGAGTGLVSIVAAKCDAKFVILTDHSKNDTVKNLALQNCMINGVSEHTQYRTLIWGVADDNLFSLPSFDILLLSDCFYDPNVFEDVAFTISVLLERNPDACAYFSYQNRKKVIYLLSQTGRSNLS